MVLSNKMLGGKALAALRRPNWALAIVAAIAIVALVLALVVPELRHLFSFSPLSLGDASTAVLAGMGSLAVNVAAAGLRRS